MARRFAAARLRRSGGGGGGAGGSSGSRPPDDPVLFDYWHSELGVSLLAGAVSSWTGQKAGTVLPFSGARPGYGADGTDFNGRNVIQCVQATSSLFAAGLPVYAANGSRPYVISIYRYRALPVPADVRTLFSLGVSGVVDAFIQRVDNPGVPRFQLTGTALSVVAASPADTNKHRYEAWADGVNVNTMVDAALVQTPSAFALTNNLTTIAVSNAAGAGAVQQSSTSHAFHAIYTAYPGAAVVAALRAYTLSYWGI